MVLPSFPSTAVHILAKNLAEALQIGKHRGYEDHDIIYVSSNYKQFIRGTHRVLYCCGQFHQRNDEREIRHFANEQKWRISYALPPVRKP